MIYNLEGIIDYIINTYYHSTELSREELKQIAYLGYLKATKKADRELTMKYVSIYIRSEINEELKKHNRYVFNKKDFEEDKYTARVLILDDIIKTEQKQEIIKSSCILTVNEKFVLNQKYLGNKELTDAEIGKLLEVSVQRVHEIRLNLIKKLRKEVNT